jgi:hypothetical protein
MIAASSSIWPSRLGQPPAPTLRTVGSLSTGRMPASVASRLHFPARSAAAAAAMPTPPSVFASTTARRGPFSVFRS